MAQATAPILNSTQATDCCESPIRSLSEAQRICREHRERLDLTKMTLNRHGWFRIAAAQNRPPSPILAGRISCCN